MTQEVHHSFSRTVRSRERNITTSRAGGSEPGWVVPSTRREIVGSSGNLGSGALNAYNNSATSGLDVTIDSGEAFVHGAYLAKDTNTTVTLDASSTIIVAIWWVPGQEDTVNIGQKKDSPSDARTLDLWEFVTDSSSVTSTTDLRNLDDYRVESNDVEATKNFSSGDVFSAYPIDHSTDITNIVDDQHHARPLNFNQSFDVSGQDTSPWGMAWNDNGSKMYMVGDSASVYSYNLTTNYDISTASFNQSFDVSGQDSIPTGMAWNDDGSKMYIVGSNNNNVYSYDLTTSYDISTASFNQSLDISGEEVGPRGITWSSDGFKMYVIGDADVEINSYDLTTSYDISTTSHNAVFSVSGEDTAPKGMSWNDDGSKMYMIGTSNDNVYQYGLSTKYEITSASFEQQYDISSQDTSSVGMSWNDDGSKMYMIGTSNDNVYSYVRVQTLKY